MIREHPNKDSRGLRAFGKQNSPGARLVAFSWGNTMMGKRSNVKRKGKMWTSIKETPGRECHALLSPQLASAGDASHCIFFVRLVYRYVQFYFLRGVLLGVVLV